MGPPVQILPWSLLVNNPAEGAEFDVIDACFQHRPYGRRAGSRFTLSVFHLDRAARCILHHDVVDGMPGRPATCQFKHPAVGSGYQSSAARLFESEHVAARKSG